MPAVAARAASGGAPTDAIEPMPTANELADRSSIDAAWGSSLNTAADTTTEHTDWVAARTTSATGACTNAIPAAQAADATNDRVHARRADVRSTTQPSAGASAIGGSRLARTTAVTHHDTSWAELDSSRSRRIAESTK